MKDTRIPRSYSEVSILTSSHLYTSTMEYNRMETSTRYIPRVVLQRSLHSFTKTRESHLFIQQLGCQKMQAWRWSQWTQRKQLTDQSFLWGDNDWVMDLEMLETKTWSSSPTINANLQEIQNIKIIISIAYNPIFSPCHVAAASLQQSGWWPSPWPWRCRGAARMVPGHRRLHGGQRCREHHGLERNRSRLMVMGFWAVGLK